MYAVALNKTLSEGADPSDGRTLIRRLWNQTFKHGLTGDIFINSKGDREADYTLNDLDPTTGEMKPVATYYGAHHKLELIPNVDINWPGGWTKPPPDVPYCGFKGDAPHCQEKEPFPVYGYAIIIGGIVVFATISIGLAAYRKVKLESELNNLWWKVQWDDIVFQDRGHRSLASIGTSEDKLSMASEKHEAKSQIGDLTESTTHGIKIGLYMGIKVAVKTMKIQRLHVSRAILLELKQIRNITHENLVRFVGFCPDEPNVALLSEFISRGSLRDLLDNDVIKIDWPFRFSIINDIVEGLVFLHNSPIGFHGHLKSTNCVIDGRFMVKITDYGLLSLLAQVAPNSRPNPQTLLWTAPEHLRNKIFGQYGSEKGDIYSFAIILQEIITRLQPFERSEKQNKIFPKEIIHKVKTGTKPPFRPEVSPEDCPLDFLNLLCSCWSEDPVSRPQISAIKQQMKKLSKGMGSGNFLDSLLNRMEQYATNLEQLVEEKSSAFLEEKKKSEALLYQVIPRYIAEQLKAGNHVKPETFESVTIFFSDIVGFTSLSAESTAMEVVDLLNDLYTTFDDILENYDVYKVETIGDAYMVVSGLPVSNGNEHAREIARMSITLREAIRNFKIRHRPERTLQIRIGMHTGSCAAGVVGLKMPRYCLFGDTVNTASRMESNGEANKIHVSPTSKAILETFRTFVISVRGEVEVKGKGKILTYWLEGETSGVLETNEQFLQRVKREIMEMSD
ncbi:atrial natriuretic peptide receptor 1-like isoform X1 [Tachypleus tridentatus]|uniref:atrial natriuretic peptide receptor 1-like isoform X1 n=1 Tax=Tachypleus tridentatus TaxID=6853 RepID=UPI003FD039F6